MKKLLSALLLTLSVLLLIFSISGCAPSAPTFDAVDKKMSSVTSYEYDTSMKITIYTNGKKATASGKGVVAVDRRNIFNPTYISDMDTTIEIEGNDEKLTSSNFVGYKNGKAYLYNRGDGKSNVLSQEMSFDDFVTLFVESDTVDLDFDAEWKVEETFGGWILSSDDCKGGATDMLIDAFSAYQEVSDHRIKGIYAKINVDRNYLVDTMEIGVNFDIDDDEEKVPSIRLVVDYKQYGYATSESDKFDLKYSDVDLKTIKSLDNEYQRMLKAKSGVFGLSITGESSTSLIKDSSILYNFNFDEGDDAYEFNGKMVLSPGVYYQFKYRYGLTNITYSGGSNQNVYTFKRPKSDAEARAFVRNIINGCGYNISLVTDIETVREGVYNVTLGNFDSGLDLVELENNGFSDVTESAVAIFTLSGDKINSVKLKYILTGKIYGTKFTYELVNNLSISYEK